MGFVAFCNLMFNDFLFSVSYIFYLPKLHFETLPTFTVFLIPSLIVALSAVDSSLQVVSAIIHIGPQSATIILAHYKQIYATSYKALIYISLKESCHFPFLQQSNPYITDNLVFR